jgi:hypothetical protein
MNYYDDDLSIQAHQRRAAASPVDPREEMMRSLGKLSSNVRDAVDTAIVESTTRGAYYNSGGSVDDRSGVKFLVRPESDAILDLNKKISFAARKLAELEPGTPAYGKWELQIKQLQETGKVQRQLEEAQAVKAAEDQAAQEQLAVLEAEIIEEASALDVINQLRKRHGLPPKQS